ncbi:MAG: hypothetical protein IAF58_18375 [Leptolyngbya sp.]|nr:hypothetical protein [Candidatus Melainabacteria bacterium]
MKIKRLLVSISMSLICFSPVIYAQGTNDFAPSINAFQGQTALGIPGVDVSDNATVGGVRGGGGRRHGGARRGHRRGGINGMRGHRRGGNRGMRGHRRGGNSGMRGANMTPEQIEARRQKAIQRFDSNHDGTIDQGERQAIEAMRLQRRQANGGQGNGGRGRRGGRNRGGNNNAINSVNAIQSSGVSEPASVPINTLTGEPSTIPADAFSYMNKKKGAGSSSNSAAKRQKLMQKFDTNGDGTLDQNETTALQAAKEQRKAAKAAQLQSNPTNF